MYKISIIIATYNASATVRRCLNSIISQLSDKNELIIVDGLSVDLTLDILNDFKEHIGVLVSEKDYGVYDAWNKGLKLASGEWIMFIGADDILLPGALDTYQALLESNNFLDCDYISANNEYLDENDTFLKLLGRGASWNLLRKGMSAAHVGSLHNRKNLFGTIGDYNLEYKICADYELLLRKGEGLKSFFLEEKIVQMRVGGMSFSSNAIIETYQIRKLHHSVGLFKNYFLFLRDFFAFKYFKFRNSV